jgi:DNA-directed RNA polymerase subunit RPC12/RpoP
MTMRVNPKDGRCRSCGGALEIIEADEASMTVECEDCGESYLVEPDAYGDGCMLYYLGIMQEKLEGGKDV